jgi:hypothetical protein
LNSRSFSCCRKMAHQRPRRQESRFVAIGRLLPAMARSEACRMNDENPLAQLLQARSPAAQQKLSHILRWMDQLDRRVSQVESSLRDLAGRSSEQDESIRMMCSVLKEIDDPYGCGQSLDERIFGDPARGPAEECDE